MRSTRSATSAGAVRARRRAGEDLKTEDVAAFDFSRVDLAFFCGRAALAERYAEAAAAHAWVIDNSPTFRARAGRAAGRGRRQSGRARAGVGSRGLVALPGSASVALATALAPLHALAGSSRVEVATYQAVSGSGRAAMDELAGETVAMLSGKHGARPGIRAADRLQRDPAGRPSGRGRRRRREERRLWEETRRAAWRAASRDQCDGGAGAGILRPQPRRACRFRAAR